MSRLPLPDPPLSDGTITLRAWAMDDVAALTGLQRLELLAHSEDAPLQRVAQKAGYTREGLLRRYRRRRGERGDLVMFSLLAEEVV